MLQQSVTSALVLALGAALLGGCVSSQADHGAARPDPAHGESAHGESAGSEAAAVADRSSRTPAIPATLVALGEHFDTARGRVFVLRIQGEYRVIRCIPDGPGSIAGCFEDVLSVSGDDVRWNTWMDVRDVPGLSVAFVSPTAVALLQRPSPE